MLRSWQGVFRLRLIPEEDLGSRRRTEVKLGLADKTVMWICCCLTPRVSGFKICLSICSSTSVCSGLPCLIVIWGLHLKVQWAPLKNAPELCRCLFSCLKRGKGHVGHIQGEVASTKVSWGLWLWAEVTKFCLSCFCAWGWSGSHLQPRSEEQLSVMVAGDWRGTKDHSYQRYSCHKELGNF